jgi:hypothetical protein
MSTSEITHQDLSISQLRTASRLVALAKARTPAVVRAESEKIEAVTPRSRRSERTRLCATLWRGESAKQESERLFREESTRRGAEAKARVIAGRAAERLVATYWASRQAR